MCDTDSLVTGLERDPTLVLGFESYPTYLRDHTDLVLVVTETISPTVLLSLHLVHPTEVKEP